MEKIARKILHRNRNMEIMHNNILKNIDIK